MFAIFVQSGCTDAVQLATSQCRFEHIGSADSTLCSSCANNRVQFVDKENHIIGLPQFLKNGLDTLLKLSTEHRSGNHATDIQGNNAFATQIGRNIALVNTTCQALDNGSLTYTWLTNEYRVILLTTSQHGDYPAKFTLTAYFRV